MGGRILFTIDSTLANDIAIEIDGALVADDFYFFHDGSIGDIVCVYFLLDFIAFAVIFEVSVPFVVSCCF